MTIAEIMNTIHQQSVENEVFELLTQWMIEDRVNKMKKIGESEATIQAIYRIATQNKNAKQAIDGIICLSGNEVGAKNERCHKIGYRNSNLGNHWRCDNLYDCG